jgi:hypothetical protein
MASPYPLNFVPPQPPPLRSSPEEPTIFPDVIVEVVPRHDREECHKFKLAETKIPDTHIENEMQCVTVFGHKICTKVPVLYYRTCTVTLSIIVCYPLGGLADVESCVTSAALAGAMAAIISGGAAGVPTFKEALEACLLAKGVKWANDVRVSFDKSSVCDGWHPA